MNRLFVYGTLRPSAPAYDLVADAVIDHCPAVLIDHVLVGEGHRYPWCIESPGGEVTGDLLWLSDAERTLAALDGYEGVDDDHPEYRRVIGAILTEHGPESAWVYVGGPASPPDARPVAGGDWLAG